MNRMNKFSSGEDPKPKKAWTKHRRDISSTLIPNLYTQTQDDLPRYFSITYDNLMSLSFKPGENIL